MKYIENGKYSFSKVDRAFKLPHAMSECPRIPYSRQYLLLSSHDHCHLRYLTTGLGCFSDG